MNKISRKLWLVLLVSFAGSLLNGCNRSKLNLLPHGPTEQEYFTEEADFQRAVFGVYGKMTDFFWYNASPFSTTMTVFILPGDDITCNDDEEFEQFGSLQPSSGRLNYLYSAIYQMIARANTLIQKIDQVADGVYQTPNLKAYNKGEALFLRGYGFYLLWNFFGTSPLDTVRVISADQFTPPSTSGTQLLDQAISDFGQAASLLPTAWDDADRGRVTANAANGMLGKSLIFRACVNKANADYSAAIAAFNKLSGVSLVDNFGDNFAWDTENNEESLFEFQASQAYGGDNIWLSNDFDNAIGDLSDYWGFYDDDPTSFKGYGKSLFYGTQKLLDAFDPGDPRLAQTMDPATRMIRKYVSRNKFVQSGGGSVNNYRLLRYADVLLLKAEAILGSGGQPADAIALINQVRTRARLMQPGGTSPANYPVTETDKKKVMDWIIKERLLELAGEGQRWFDLRRWEMAGAIQLDNAYFSSNTPNMSFQLPKHLLFPIPNSEIDVNPNVQQNVGY